MIKRLMQTAVLILAVSFLSSQHSHACSCAYAGEFTEYSKGHTVIRGKVNSYGLTPGGTGYETMTVSVDELIQGSFNHSMIEFIGDPGHLCLSNVNSVTYPIGSEHLFTVFSEDKKQGLGGCGEVSVSIIDGKVEGTKYTDVAQENWAQYSIEYNKFVENLITPLIETKPLKKPKALIETKPLLKPKPWWKFW